VADPYCWDGTSCLRNRLNIRDAAALAGVEARIVAVRDVEITRQSLPGGYDLAHLKLFHRHLFGDIYDWAGETRTVDILKSESRFAHWRYLDDHISAVLEELSHDDWLMGLKQAPFVARIAHYYGEINAAHPFREGNGRTQRAFLRQLGAAAGFALDWSELTAEANNRACAHNLRTADESVLIELLAPIVFRL
jgi:cell filamentation protein